MDGVTRTFRKLWSLVPNSNAFSQLPDPLRVTLLDGVQHKIGLRWEVIDFMGRRDPNKLWNDDIVDEPGLASEIFPTAGVLAAVAHCRELLTRLDRRIDPSELWLPGYRVNASPEFRGRELVIGFEQYGQVAWITRALCRRGQAQAVPIRVL